MERTTKTKGLWTKDFTKITLTSAISIIGGEIMHLPMSLLVFDETQSTFLAAFILVCGMLPDILLSIVVAPLIDRGSKKRWIVVLDVLFFLTFAWMGLYTWRSAFHYGAYVLFTLVESTLAVFYRLAYDAWYPDLIPVGLEQKGFSVAGMLQDSITIVMAPVATILYTLMPIHLLLFISAATIVLAIFIEAQISVDGKIGTGEDTMSLQSYFVDLKEGFRYFKKEKGVRNIFTYMSISFSTGDGIYVLERTYFQTTPHLGITRYGFATSASMAARLLSGIFLYKKKVPVKKRFAVVKFVYMALNVLTGVLLFLPYPLIIADYAMQGGLGNTSYTLRETATKSYIPAEMRARIGAIFNLMISTAGVLFTLLAGYIGDRIPIRAAVVGFAIFNALAVILLIYLPGRVNRPVYEAERTEEV
ncbi:MAG: MFS transporter [Lachnospiraceae bacterium]|nr:MFS transporter [Lachnospiraceae bacterium]